MSLFDHLVGARQWSRRYIEPKGTIDHPPNARSCEHDASNFGSAWARKHSQICSFAPNVRLSLRFRWASTWYIFCGIFVLEAGDAREQPVGLTPIFDSMWNI
jgi:hypothetical protein